MAVPSTIQALIILALVLAPGYVFTRTIARVTSEVEEPPDLRFLVTVTIWGLVIHGLLLLVSDWLPWWPRWIPQSQEILNYYSTKLLLTRAEDVALWALFSLALIPWALGQLTARIVGIEWIDKNIMDRLDLSIVQRTPTAWQYVINKEESAYALVFLKDGRVIGGCYTKNSFASANPKHGDLYLETRCQLNDAYEFQYGIPHSKGIWIAHDVISHVEFREDVEFPTAKPESAVVTASGTGTESTDHTTPRPKRGTRATTKRLAETAAATARTQAL